MTHVTTLDGKLITCTDAVFSLEECFALYEQFQRTPFYRSETDFPDAPYKSFVNRWNTGDEPWARTSARVFAHAQSLSAKPLERLYELLGCALYGEHYVPHYDSEELEHLTALLYLNPEWKPEWYGETMFYSSQTPEILSFLPSPGRVLVFDSTLYHRVGIPSRVCPSSRATLVMKLRASRSDNDRRSAP